MRSSPVKLDRLCSHFLIRPLPASGLLPGREATCGGGDQPSGCQPGLAQGDVLLGVGGVAQEEGARGSVSPALGLRDGLSCHVRLLPSGRSPLCPLA